MTREMEEVNEAGLVKWKLLAASLRNCYWEEYEGGNIVHLATPVVSQDTGTGPRLEA